MSDLPRNVPGEKDEPLLSPDDVARRCGLSRRAIYRAIACGELPASRLRNRLRVRPADLEDWISARGLVRVPIESHGLSSQGPARRGSLRAMLDRDAEED